MKVPARYITCKTCGAEFFALAKRKCPMCMETVRLDVSTRDVPIRMEDLYKVQHQNKLIKGERNGKEINSKFN